MHDGTSRSTRCTIQRADGSFCDGEAHILVSYPVCGPHAIRIYTEVKASLSAMVDVPRMREGQKRLEEQERREAESAAIKEAQSLVYYVRIGKTIKIGKTSDMKTRMQAMQVMDPSNILATEPGGYKLERQRHLQFKHLRIGRSEHFEPTLELIRHIESVQEFHGPPTMTRNAYFEMRERREAKLKSSVPA